MYDRKTSLSEATEKMRKAFSFIQSSLNQLQLELDAIKRNVEAMQKVSQDLNDTTKAFITQKGDASKNG